MVYLVNFQDVPRYNLGRIDLNQATVPDDQSLESQCFLQFLHNGACLVLLNKPNNCVDGEKGANNAKVNPISETSSQDRSSLWLEENEWVRIMAIIST